MASHLMGAMEALGFVKKKQKVSPKDLNDDQLLLIWELLQVNSPGGVFPERIYKPPKGGPGIPKSLPIYRLESYWDKNPELLSIPLAEYLSQTYGEEYLYIDNPNTKVSYKKLDMDKIHIKNIDSLKVYIDNFSENVDNYNIAKISDVVKDYSFNNEVIRIMKGEVYLKDNAVRVKSPGLLNHGSDGVYAKNLKLWIEEQRDKAKEVIDKVGNGGNIITYLDEYSLDFEISNFEDLLTDIDLFGLIQFVNGFIFYEDTWKDLVLNIDYFMNDRQQVIDYLKENPILREEAMRPGQYDHHDGFVTIDNLKDMKMEELRQLLVDYKREQGGKKTKRKRTKKKKKKKKPKKNKQSKKKKSKKSKSK
jgi:hypothetical protein